MRASALVALLAVMPAGAEQWPVRDTAAIERRDPGRGPKSLRAYQQRKYGVIRSHSYGLENYLCRGFDAIPVESTATSVDALGLPMRAHLKGAYDHPIMTARVALYSATAYSATANPVYLVWMKSGADKLLASMSSSGALRYPVAFPLYYGPQLQPGWTSGMAQGVALSALARAYQLTCDERYREGGRSALRHLLTPIEQGGTATNLRHLHPSLERYVWFEEYPNPQKPAYTLNGFMYTLLGLYDWSLVDPASDAGRQLAAGVQTLTKVLPYYEYDGFTAYDLAPLVYGWKANFNPHYHAVHITLLSALYAATGEKVLRDYETRWYAAVGGPVVECGGPGRARSAAVPGDPGP